MSTEDAPHSSVPPLRGIRIDEWVELLAYGRRHGTLTAEEIVDVLHDVEPGNPRFLEGGGGIGAGGVDEGGDVVGDDPDVYMDDEHGRWGGLRCPLTGRTRRLGQHPGFVPATGSGLDSRQQ